MIEAPLQVDCYEVRDKMPGGITEPLLVKAIDAEESEYTMVLKCRSAAPGTPPDAQYGGTSLACELTCSMLARALNMRVPDYAIVTVSRELVESIAEPGLRTYLRQNIGPNFGTVYMPGYRLWDSSYPHSSEILLDRLEGVLTFDATVINGDRSIRKPNLLWRGDDVLPIDHALALIVHQWDAATAATSPLFPESHIRQHCAFGALNNKGRQYEDLFCRWASGINQEQLADIRLQIPEEWEQHPGHLDAIFTFLGARDAKFPQVSAGLRRIVQ